MNLVVTKNTELDFWLVKQYYHSIPAGKKIRMDFKNKNVRIGAIYFLWSENNQYDCRKTLELCRMYFIPGTSTTLILRAMKKARKYIRKCYPQVKGLITSNFSADEHVLNVLRADGWFQIWKSLMPVYTPTSQGGFDEDYTTARKFARIP